METSKRPLGEVRRRGVRFSLQSSLPAPNAYSRVRAVPQPSSFESFYILTVQRLKFDIYYQKIYGKLFATSSNENDAVQHIFFGIFSPFLPRLKVLPSFYALHLLVVYLGDSAGCIGRLAGLALVRSPASAFFRYHFSFVSAYFERHNDSEVARTRIRMITAKIMISACGKMLTRNWSGPWIACSNHFTVSYLGKHS